MVGHPTLGWGDNEGGYFEVYSPIQRSKKLSIIASCGDGWDHVSVSLPFRCPVWQEMEYVKRLFFLPNETAIQYHPAETYYINNHPYCLHMWRPQNIEMIMPPIEMV